MLHQFHFQVVTGQSRYEILPAIREAVSAAGAWVTNFHQSPAGAAVFELEASVGEIPSLHARLLALGLSVEPSLGAVTELFRHQMLKHPERPLEGTVQVRFVGQEHDFPGLKRIL